MHTSTKNEKMIATGLIVVAAVIILLGTNIFADLALGASIGFGVYGMVRPFKPGPLNPFDLQARLGMVGLAMVIIGWLIDLVV